MLITVEIWQLILMAVIAFVVPFLGAWIGRERRLTHLENGITSERELRELGDTSMVSRCELIQAENGRTFKRLAQNQEKIFDWLRTIDGKVTVLNGLQKGSA